MCSRVILILSLVATPSLAQVPQRSRTTLKIEIITARGTNDRIAAQEWGRVFAKLGQVVRIRAQTAADGDGPADAVTERASVSGVRVVTAVGLLDRNGRLHFGTKKFSATDVSKLKAWIEGLRKFGKSGDPSGRPVWGLSETQFTATYDAMSKPLTQSTSGRPLAALVKTLEKPAGHAIRWDDSARVTGKSANVSRELEGYSLGTALAMALNDHGLGFFPQRQPNGKVDLLIVPQSGKRLWPLGWEPRNSLSKTAPGFFQRVPVKLNKVRLSDLFPVITKRTQIPIFVDHFQIRKKGMDYKAMRITIESSDPTRERKLSWNRVIQTATVKNRLNHELRIDELGKPFVWVTTPEIVRARRERFRPKK